MKHPSKIFLKNIASRYRQISTHKVAKIQLLTKIPNPNPNPNPNPIPNPNHNPNPNPNLNPNPNPNRKTGKP